MVDPEVVKKIEGLEWKDYPHLYTWDMIDGLLRAAKRNNLRMAMTVEAGHRELKVVVNALTLSFFLDGKHIWTEDVDSFDGESVDNIDAILLMKMAGRG